MPQFFHQFDCRPLNNVNTIMTILHLNVFVHDLRFHPTTKSIGKGFSLQDRPRHPTPSCRRSYRRRPQQSQAALKDLEDAPISCKALMACHRSTGERQITGRRGSHLLCRQRLRFGTRPVRYPLVSGPDLTPADLAKPQRHPNSKQTGYRRCTNILVFFEAMHNALCESIHLLQIDGLQCFYPLGSTAVQLQHLEDLVPIENVKAISENGA